MANSTVLTNIEASLNFNGVVYALDDQTLISKNGAGLTLYKINNENGTSNLSGTNRFLQQQFIPLPSPCTAFNIAPQAKLVVAAVGTREPSLFVFSYTNQTLVHTMTLSYPPNVANDSPITAVAISRDGQRILSVTNLPHYTLIIHNGTTGEIIPQSEPYRMKGLVTKLSICPGNPDLFLTTGPRIGLTFYKLTKSYTTLEISTVQADIPSVWSDYDTNEDDIDSTKPSTSSSKGTPSNSVPVAALSAIMDEGIDNLVPSALTRHKVHQRHSNNNKPSTVHYNQYKSERAIMEFIDESVQVDAAGSGVSTVTTDYASNHVANKRGRNVWIAVTWITEQYIAATNGTGDVLIYSTVDGKILKRFNFNSSNSLINLESDPGTIGTAIVATATHLLIGCSDGNVRYLTLPEKGEDISTTEHGFFLTSSLQLVSSNGNGNSSSTVRGAALCISSITISPSYGRIYAGTLYGTIHTLPASSKDLLPLLKGVRRNSHSFQVTSNHAVYESSPTKSTLSSVFLSSVANIDKQGNFLSTTPVPTNEAYCVTAHNDNTLRVWSCTARKGGNDTPTVFGPVATCLSQTTIGSTLVTPSSSPINTTTTESKLSENIESKDGKETEDLLLNAASTVTGTFVSSSLSTGTTKTIVCLTSHVRLPLVAVGCLDGTLYLYRISYNTSTLSYQFTLVAQDNSHTTAITSLLFSDVYQENRSILISIASASSLLVVHDLQQLLRSGSGNSTGTNISSAVGFCRLPVASSSNATTTNQHAVTSIAWSTSSSTDTLTLLLGTSSGYLLSLTIPYSTFPTVLPVTSYTQLIDYTKYLAFRVRFGSGISGIATSYHAGTGSNASPTVAFVSIVGEMSLTLLPIDSLSSTPITNILDTTSFNAYPIANSDSFTKLNAHKRSAVCLAISPIAYASSSVILASGGMDGALTILLLSIGNSNSTNSTSLRVNVTGSSYTLIHQSTITSIKFSNDGRTLSVTAGLEGHCTTVALNGEAVTKAETTSSSALGNKGIGRSIVPSEAALLRPSNTESSVSSSSSSSSATVVTYKGILEAVTAAHEMAAVQEHATVHNQLLAEVQSFRERLHTILRANEAAPALERLDRTEFIIDQTGADNITAEYNRRVTERKEAYAQENALLDADINRIKATCVETSETLACEIRALTIDTSVRNFPYRKRRNSEHQLIEKMVNLRAIEIATTVNERGVDKLGNSTNPTTTNGAGIAWKGLANRIPPDSDWLYYTGLLAPSVDIAKQHEDILSTKSATATTATGNDKKGTVPPPGAKPTADATAATDAAATDGETKEGTGNEKEKEDKGLQWEGIDIIKYLYHPLAVRTPAQKRTQRMFLTELLRATQAKFNASFDKLRNEKHEVLDGIKSRHNRLKEILTELGTPVIHMTEKDTKSVDFSTGTNGDILNAVLYAAGLTPTGLPLSSRPKSAGNDRPTSAATNKTHTSTEGLTNVPPGRTPIGPVPGENGMTNITDPFFATSEDPQSILKVTDTEIGMVPYVSPAEQKRREEEAERKRRAAAANKDDAPERALMDMMGGTLEGKDELTALAESLVREPWMDEVPEADFTPEQKATYAAYKVRLQAFEDEKAKARNALNSEMTKLLQELKDLVAAFDEKVALLSKVRITTASVIAAQELYMTKLALNVQIRQHMAVRDTGLQAQFDALIPSESAAAEAHENFKIFVERQAVRVEELMQKDKGLDTTFRSSIKEAVGTLDSDIVKMLQSLFRKRETTATLIANKTLQEAAAVAAANANATVSSSSTVTSPPRPTLKRQASNAATLRRYSGDGSSATNTLPPPVDPFAYYAQTVSKAIDDELKQQTLREAVLSPLTKNDCPDGYSNLADDPVWNVLNNLRREKIQSEFLLQDEQKLLENMKNHLALLASRFEKRKAEIDNVAAERDSLAAARELALLDVEVLLRLRMGQDEVSANLPDGRPHPKGGNPIVQWNDAMLVPGDIIENVNKDIRKLGQVKVDHLNDIKSFKKGLRYQQWEAEYRTACTSDIHEFHRDLQLMRAVGPVKDFIVGINAAAKARQELDKAEQKLAHYRRAHVRNLQGMEKTITKLEKDVVEKEHTIVGLQKTAAELREGVTLRETILRSRKGGNGPVGGTTEGEANTTVTETPNAVAEKMHNIAVRSKLTGIAKAQAEEIAALQIELHRLRTKSYAAL